MSQRAQPPQPSVPASVSTPRTFPISEDWLATLVGLVLLVLVLGGVIVKGMVP